ncbi:MAG: hypothetical protein Q9190_007054 [Brigantiaea leucoxantha]
MSSTMTQPGPASLFEEQSKIVKSLPRSLSNQDTVSRAFEDSPANKAKSAIDGSPATDPGVDCGDFAGVQDPGGIPRSLTSSTFNTREAVKSLALQLGKTRLETAAPSLSTLDNVASGLQLNMGTTSTLFHTLRWEAKRVDKRKRDMGVLPKLNTKRQKHGFQPEELLWHEAIELRDCKSSNLTNEIHPLLSRDCFDDTPDPIYDQLMPGLRLATMFLTQPVCMQFWVTLAKGDRKRDAEMSKRYGQSRHRIIRNVDLTKKNSLDMIRYINDLGLAKVIHYTWSRNLLYRGHHAFGVAARVCRFSNEDQEGRNGKLQNCHIRLNSDYYTVAKKMSQMKYPDEAQKLRFNLNVATIMVHELAHAIELSQWRNRSPSAYEPFLLNHNEAELGHCWEAFLFGGRVAPINDRVDANFGIGTYDWPTPFGEMNPERTIVRSVSMRYVERLQQMATWEQTYSLDEWRTFHIPKDGATSVYLNAVTTVPWSEEERIMKEELNELKRLEKEEPAKKKREMADGAAVVIEAVEVTSEDIGSREKNSDDREAQPTTRIKKEPQSVLSKRQKRAQLKAQRANEKEKSKEA